MAKSKPFKINKLNAYATYPLLTRNHDNTNITEVHAGLMESSQRSMQNEHYLKLYRKKQAKGLRR